MADAQQQAAAIAELRKQGGPAVAQWPDRVLDKFLVARQYKMDKALLMLNNYLAWTASYGTANVLNEYFGEEINQMYPCGFVGYDKQRNPIYVERPGQVKPKEIFEKFSQDWLLRWHVCINETAKNMYMQSGGYGLFVIMDVAGMGLKHADKKALKFVQAMSKLDQDYYPEHLACCFVINAGTIFPALWKLVSGFVDERTRSKIKVCGKDYQKQLLELVDANQLPKWLGGTKDDATWRSKLYGSPDPRNAARAPKAPGASDHDVSGVPDVNTEGLKDE